MIDERRGGAENFRPSRSIFGYPPPKKTERPVLPIPSPSRSFRSLCVLALDLIFIDSCRIAG